MDFSLRDQGVGSFLVGKVFTDLHYHADCLHVVVSVVKAASLVVILLVCTVMLDGFCDSDDHLYCHAGCFCDSDDQQMTSSSSDAHHMMM